jgi:hypothetical protein
MPNRFGRGTGGGKRMSAAGMGFGFGGSSPPWPYTGRGRGGLPRGAYPSTGVFGTIGRWLSPYRPGYQAGPGVYQQYAPPAYATRNVPSDSQVTPDQELDFLRDQAEAVNEQLEHIEARIKDLESDK